MLFLHWLIPKGSDVNERKLNEKGCEPAKKGLTLHNGAPSAIKSGLHHYG